MHKTPHLVITVASCLAILLSSTLPWSASPQYSLFTIADYAGSYSKYVSESAIIAIGAFLIPIFACVTLVSIPLRRTSLFLSCATGLYCFAICIVVIGLFITQSGTLPLLNKNPGIYLCLAASLVLFANGILTVFRRVE